VLLLRSAELQFGGRAVTENREMHMPHRIVVGAVCLGLLAVSLGAQQKPQPAAPKPAAQFQARVELVTVDVSVLDRDRRPVRGLTAADFTILEDGKPQPIQTFSAIDLPDAEEASATWVRNVAPDVRRNDDLADRRIVTIVLDDALPMSPLLAPRVKEAARAVVERLGPRDLAAVVYPLAKNHGQDYTGDRDRLLKAIDSYSGGSMNDDGVGGPIRLRFMYESMISTIRMLTEYLEELPNRRKALILISQGIPLDVTELGPRANLSNGNDAAGILRNVVVQLREAFAAAQHANVNIYAIDPGGLDPMATSTAIDFLRGIADQTGGFAVIDTNDPQSGIAQIYRENSSYYLLGYPSPNPRAEGRFRKIEVRVSRPGLMVRARTGYYEPERARPVEKAKPAPSPLWTALAALLPKGDVAMQVVATSFATADAGKTAVAIVAGLRQPAPAGADSIVEHVKLLITAYDPGGSRKASVARDVRVTLRPRLAGDVGYEVVARMDLKPGRYQLRLAAQSAMQGKAGSVFYDIDVPNFSKGGLSMSGLAVSATPGPTSAPKDGLAGLIPIVPTSGRDFATSDRATTFLRVYQGGKDALTPVTMTARIVDGRGATVFDTTETIGADRFAPARAADYRFDVPLTQLKPGLYLLTIRAAQGKRTASRDVRFTVR
jgi:VWFA-related protein